MEQDDTAVNRDIQRRDQMLINQLIHHQPRSLTTQSGTRIDEWWDYLKTKLIESGERNRQLTEEQTDSGSCSDET